MTSAPESFITGSNQTGTTSNIVSTPTDSGVEEENPSEPEIPEGSTPGEGVVEYSKKDGYFYFEDSIYEGPESISELIYVRYYFDESKEYSQGEKIKIKAKV